MGLLMGLLRAYRGYEVDYLSQLIIQAGGFRIGGRFSVCRSIAVHSSVRRQKHRHFSGLHFLGVDKSPNCAPTAK